MLAVGLVTVVAADDSVTGKWRGSNGRWFIIPVSTGRFSLTSQDSSGDRKSFPAVWEKPGETFNWVDANQSKHTVVYEKAHKPVRFRDVGEAYPDSPAYWYRETR